MKLFYTIGEVADLLDLPTSTVRFWESQFDVLKPSKNALGHRKFTAKDVENLKTIYHLVKEKGMTLEGAKRRLRSGSDEVRHDGEIMERLLGIRALLVEIRNELGEEGEPVFEAPVTEPATVPPTPEAAPSLSSPSAPTPSLSSRSERSESRDLIPPPSPPDAPSVVEQTLF